MRGKGKWRGGAGTKINKRRNNNGIMGREHWRISCGGITRQSFAGIAPYYSAHPSSYMYTRERVRTGGGGVVGCLVMIMDLVSPAGGSRYVCITETDYNFHKRHRQLQTGKREIGVCGWVGEDGRAKGCLRRFIDRARYSRFSFFFVFFLANGSSSVSRIGVENPAKIKYTT